MSFPLADVYLGDLIELPDGRHLAVRSKSVLPTPVDTLAGFLVAGELEVLLGTPDLHTAPIAVYVKHRFADPRLGKGVELARGISSYWSPHLPGIRSAMAELTWRIIRMPGSPWPAVVVYRGDEAVLFLRTHDVPPADLRVRHLSRKDDDRVQVERYAASVGAPVDPQAEPSTLYERLTANQPAATSRSAPSHR